MTNDRSGASTEILVSIEASATLVANTLIMCIEAADEALRCRLYGRNLEAPDQPEARGMTQEPA
jgi:hypothetical protein